jgi:uncharacterized protein YggE
MNRLLSVVFCLASICSAAQVQQQSQTVPPNTVVVTAQGTFEAQPDTAVLRFTISTAEKTAKAAYERAGRGVDDVRNILKSAGVDAGVAHFGYFALSPTYDYKGNGKRKIVQFTVNTNVEVRLKDFDKAGPILDQLATMDITGDQTLNYIVENTDTAKAKAVEDAVARARGEAEAIARGGNRTLGGIIYASVDTQERFQPYRPMLAAEKVEAESGGGFFSHKKVAPPAPPPPPPEGFTPGPVTITAQVNAIFGLK